MQPPPAPPSNRFERNARRTLAGIWIGLAAIMLLLSEGVLRLAGLGTPIVYEESPVYGYRPVPDQFVHRLHGATIRINNVGFRALHDWDARSSDKVLFVGNSVTYGGSYVITADLFAERAIPPASARLAGVAGVNGWGVDNMWGFLAGQRLDPADVYVTVLIDDDFSRGLRTLPPELWTWRPHSALVEGAAHLAILLRERLSPGPSLSGDSLTARRLLAVRHLRAIDEYLRARGKTHLIYLSPDLDNVLGRVPRDTQLVRWLGEYSVPIAFLEDRPEIRRLPADALAALYHDGVHLSPAGHALWAAMIRADLARTFSTR